MFSLLRNPLRKKKKFSRVKAACTQSTGDARGREAPIPN